MPDYANGKIYCIRNRADNDSIVYIGSTVRPLSERMCGHRSALKIKPDIKIYKLMTEVGVDQFHIELITNFPCENVEQLLAEEGRHIRLNDTLKSGANTHNAGVTPAMLKEYRTEYKAQNKEKIKEANRIYYDAHKVETAATAKAYRETHKEQYAENMRAFRARMSDEQKAATAAKKRAYNAAHKVENAARMRAYNARKRAEVAVAAAAVVDA